jgi:molecular chaperone GrpE
VADIPETFPEHLPGTGDVPASPDVEIEVGEPTTAADPSSVEAEAPDLEAQVELLTAQLEESFARARETQTRLKDEHERLLRTAAEFENFRRRALKEREDLGKYGNERLLKDFLPVADNLERALDHADALDAKVVIEGVRLVQKILTQALGKHGVTGFSAVGAPFDPALHEALMQQDSELAPGTVVAEMAKGYKLHERLLRPAAVVVAKAAAGTQVSDDVGEGGTPGGIASSSGGGNGSN